MPLNTCHVCRKAHDGPSSLECEDCKAEKRRLAAIHQEARAEECEADRAGKALRLALYRKIIELGGRLFE